ncbi:MAG TPA: fused MFS/spermidine synthase [Polyangiaceae bacterium]
MDGLRAQGHDGMLLYAVTIFVSAFLLFMIQPIVGRLILPWFGGGATVWNACLVFYQALLLGGYCHAHWTTTRLSARASAALHCVLSLVGLVALVVAFPPPASWSAASSPAAPELRILMLLTTTIGAPYFVISASGPLLQRWFCVRFAGATPYRLFAVSNAGSLLALLAYPFAIEPWLRLSVQSRWWQIGYALFVLLCGTCAWQIRRAPAPPLAPDATSRDTDARSARPALFDCVLVLALAACGSAMLLATTNQLCQDIAALPFLLILPLCLYLLSFVICFDNPRWYQRGWFAVFLALSFWGAVTLLRHNVEMSPFVLEESRVGSWLAQQSALRGAAWLKLEISALTLQVSGYAAALLAACLVCHGEMARLKPHPSHLTLFYLLVACGGVLGGGFVALVAPLIFDAFWEFPLSLVCVTLLFGISVLREAIRKRPRFRSREGRQLLAFVASAMVGTLLLGRQLSRRVDTVSSRVIEMKRNFYGALRVIEDGVHDPRMHKRKLMHGEILHGSQFRAPEKRGLPTSYYGLDSAIALAAMFHPSRLAGRTLRLGVVGLGTGTTAVYASAGDLLHYYEINPDVVDIAERRFDFLRDARSRGARVVISVGDARVVMEHELERGRAPRFDVLAVDAFSSDAIPMHLLTRECFRVYWRHLETDGILAVHISNRYIDLAPVVRQLASDLGKRAHFIQGQDDEERGLSASDWVAVTSNRAFVQDENVYGHIVPWSPQARPPIAWSDDFSSVYALLW